MERAEGISKTRKTVAPLMQRRWERNVLDHHGGEELCQDCCMQGGSIGRQNVHQ